MSAIDEEGGGEVDGEVRMRSSRMLFWALFPFNVSRKIRRCTAKRVEQGTCGGCFVRLCKSISLGKTLCLCPPSVCSPPLVLQNSLIQPTSPAVQEHNCRKS